MKTLPLSDKVNDLLRTIEKAGGRPIIVGGAVRDFLLDRREPKDIDIEVFGIEAEVLKLELASVHRVDAVGSAFGVIKVHIDEGTSVDVSLPRRENKQGQGHRGFLVTPDPKMTYAEASNRRDFTINSIGFDVRSGTYIDPHGGISDLESKTLRHVSDHFDEDPLRVLRGCQFSARFGLKMTSETIKKCQSLKGELKTLPVERLWEEWRKLLLKSERPSVGIERMREVGALEVLFPELHALIGISQDPVWHPEGQDHELGSLWVHNQMVVDEAAKIIRRDGLMEDEDEALVVMLGALCHDLGKPSVTELKDGRWRSPSHEPAGGPITGEFLLKVGCPPTMIEKIIPLVMNHLAPSVFHKTNVGKSAIRRLAIKVPLLRLVRVAEADYFGRDTPDAIARTPYAAGEWLLDAASKLSVLTEGPKPYLLGRHLLDLGYKPGPKMGQFLRIAFEAQLDDEFSDVEGAKEWAKSFQAKRDV